MPAIIVRGCRIFPNTVIAASGVATSEAIAIDSSNAISLHLAAITGTSPSVTFTYSLSPDGDDWITPPGATAIGSTKSAADVMAFTPACAKYIKIIATNVNATNQVTILAYLCVQDLS